jgi:predicted nucleotidyltransferase
MNTFSEIKRILHEHAGELHERYGITNLAVFGSVVRDEATEKSDVDVLADFDRPIGLIRLCSAENYLIELLGREVDLIPRDEVRPELKEGIDREAVAV